MNAENVVVTPASDVRPERRTHSRNPLRVVLAAVFLVAALWLVDLYTDPGWSKIQSFLVGWFLGTFVMDWIRQRADRAPELQPAPARSRPMA